MKEIIVDAERNTVAVGDKVSQPVSILYNKLVPLTPQLGLLPAVVRYISPINAEGMSTIVVENRPRKILVYRTEEKNYMMPIPWQHWFIRVKAHDKYPGVFVLDEVRFALSETQLQSMDHQFIPGFGIKMIRMPDKVYGDAVAVVQFSKVNRYVASYYITDPMNNVGLDGCRSLSDVYDFLTTNFWHIVNAKLEDIPEMKDFLEGLFPDVDPEATSFNQYRMMTDNLTFDQLFDRMSTGHFQNKYVTSRTSFIDILAALEQPRPVDMSKVMTELYQETAEIPVAKKFINPDKVMPDLGVGAVTMANLQTVLNQLAEENPGLVIAAQQVSSHSVGLAEDPLWFSMDSDPDDPEEYEDDEDDEEYEDGDLL
jgi:hypothetical protein